MPRIAKQVTEHVMEKRRKLLRVHDKSTNEAEKVYLLHNYHYLLKYKHFVKLLSKLGPTKIHLRPVFEFHAIYI